ncbi:hypothetical protein [Nocardioides coralli]|uniref:hypothetical protein n=1 Tax=Nocardioides coralli TaxID=2872154 RepID=UPI001CA38930|nr:hypothetical protein [Nocardioides coralli]QZY29368.1 hypothetical protein K6T13_01255 [Nocardioides coralli]
MADRSGPGTRPGTAPTSRATGRQPRPGRRQLLGGVAMVALGSFMPWLDTAVGTVSGVRGAGLWTFYAAMLGLAGALVPSRRLAIAQGSLLALVAVALPVWQVVHVLGLVGTAGWMPGPGLVLVFGGGVVAAVAVRKMVTHQPVSR